MAVNNILPLDEGATISNDILLDVQGIVTFTAYGDIQDTHSKFTYLCHVEKLTTAGWVKILELTPQQNFITVFSEGTYRVCRIKGKVAVDAALMNIFVDFYSYAWSAGSLDGFDITTNVDGTVNISSGSAVLRDDAYESAALLYVEFPGINNLALNIIKIMSQPDLILLTGSGMDCSFSQSIKPEQTEAETKLYKYLLIGSIKYSLTSLTQINKNITFKQKCFYFNKLKIEDKSKETASLEHLCKIKIISSLTNVMKVRDFSCFKLKFKKFKQWRDKVIFQQLNENVIKETETRMIKKFQNKNSALEMNLSKMDKENSNLELKIKDIKQSIQLKDKEIIEATKLNMNFEEKYKNEERLLLQLKEELNSYLNNKQNNKFALERIYENLCDEVNKIKDEINEKDQVINNYIQEQNEILDYQERKFRELAEKNKSGTVFTNSNNSFYKKR